MRKNQLAPRPCKGKCGQQTRHKSGQCAECRYHDERDATEVRYEVAIAKGTRPSLQELTRPVDTQQAIYDGE